MVQRRAAELVDAVRPDGPLHLRPRQALEFRLRGVYDLEVPRRDVGEEGRALGGPLGFGDVQEPVGEGPFSGFVFGEGGGGRVGGLGCHCAVFGNGWRCWILGGDGGMG